MAASQTVLFTPVPRASADADPLPVSVVVSPRLVGEPTLGAYPDWLTWTRRIQEQGLTLTFACAGATVELPVDPASLRPELWEALFSAETLVRSHEFDDHSQRGVQSFPYRGALSLLKATYQDVGLALALPDRNPVQREGGDRARSILRGALANLAVGWDAEKARAWPAQTRLDPGLRNLRANYAVWFGDPDAPRDAEGLTAQRFPPGDPGGPRDRFMRAFAAFHHMPAPPPLDDAEPVDHRETVDFHQVLSSLGSYRELQRALGLIFDLELPRDFLPETPDPAAPGTLELAGATPGWEWAAPTQISGLTVAYAHLSLAGQRLFAPWSRALTDERLSGNVLGVLHLREEEFGLAQVDADGGLLKAAQLAEALLDPESQPARPRHPEVFDDTATLPALRSGGLSLYADLRAFKLISSFRESRALNDAVAGGARPRPLTADDLARGYRLDVWDSFSGGWHSLHLRRGSYQLGEQRLDTEREEGFVQLAATRAAPGAPGGTSDLYLHEVVARWAGWSLSAPRPGRALSRFADPARAVPQDDPAYALNEPATPFPMAVAFSALPGTLPRLKFGRAYRVRARAVDLAGNSLAPDAPLAELLDDLAALPKRAGGRAGYLPYLRYEPVPAPLVVPRDPGAVTGPGSGLERLVIRSFNSDPSLDAAPPDRAAGDRHILPPRTTVDLAEKLGMFDDAAGRVSGDPAMWELIRGRDAAELGRPAEPVVVAGQQQEFPVELAEALPGVPFLPDALARGAALRDLPGAPGGAVARLRPAEGVASPAPFEPIADANPRPGSATMVSFAGEADWQAALPFRLDLDEGDGPPEWDPAARVLTVRLPKGRAAVTPLSSYLDPDDLKLMGVWQWLRERIERLATDEAVPQVLREGDGADRVTHILQRAVEGGHWMLSPPRLLTLVHAVQQPLGLPQFVPVSGDHDAAGEEAAIRAGSLRNPLQTAPLPGPTAPEESAAVTAWRRPGSTDAYLVGGLRVHGASTARVDLRAEWVDPVDDPDEPEPGTVARSGPVDTLELHTLEQSELVAAGAERRLNGYYDPEQDTIIFARAYDRLGIAPGGSVVWQDAAPRHAIDDARRHRVRYRAVATSRYREYFDQAAGLDFTRTGAAVEVDVPASARPLAPGVAYLVPTFAWQRQTTTNIKRSVRFGGGLRVYLNRPWYSSGEGELLGVLLSRQFGEFDREAWKPFISQWGADPIWQSGPLARVPGRWDFDGYSAADESLTLEEPLPRDGAQPGRVGVVGFPVEFDRERRLWYADITLNPGASYAPFVRLALARYQPHALPDAKLSRVVLADFAQLTPDRSLVVTGDPYDARRLKVTLSGLAPRGPAPLLHAQPQPPRPAEHPTEVAVRVQRREEGLTGDLAWRDATGEAALSEVRRVSSDRDLLVWTGTVTFSGGAPAPGEYRLLVEEREYVSANYVELQQGPDGRVVSQPSRPLYLETVELDAALLTNALQR